MNNDMRQIHHKLVVWVLIALAVLAVYAVGCGRQTEAVVSRRDIIATLPLSGQTGVPPSAEANVGAPYEAPVDRVHVTVGQSVRRGDVLMELRAPQSQAYYEQSRQRVIQARQQLQQAERRYNAEVQTASRDLEQARQAERSARQAARPSPDVTVSQVEVTETPDMAAAIERRRQAEQALLDAQARRDAALTPYRQQLVAAEQQLQDAQAGLSGAMVRTPIAGTVLEVNARTGDMVGQDRRRAVARVVDLSSVKVYAPVDRRVLSQVQPRRPANVTVREVPNEEFSGMVEQVYSRRAGLPWDAEHLAVVDFHNREGLVKPGMSAQTAVQVGEARDVLAVPSAAVREIGGEHTVRVRQGEEWHDRIVEIGLSDGRYTEIRSGLGEGDIVLVNW